MHEIMVDWIEEHIDDSPEDISNYKPENIIKPTFEWFVYFFSLYPLCDDLEELLKSNKKFLPEILIEDVIPSV